MRRLTIAVCAAALFSLAAAPAMAVPGGPPQPPSPPGPPIWQVISWFFPSHPHQPTPPHGPKGPPVYHSTPGPEAGIGLPVMAAVGGYLLYRRRRRKTQNPEG